ncbi:hypothetical protein BHE74_00023665 [Ensete ventricosum]|nr:hypothetical protein BHE74_00023665 [Ensete ventricosum]
MPPSATFLAAATFLLLNSNRSRTLLCFYQSPAALYLPCHLAAATRSPSHCPSLLAASISVTPPLPSSSIQLLSNDGKLFPLIRSVYLIKSLAIEDDPLLTPHPPTTISRSPYCNRHRAIFASSTTVAGPPLPAIEVSLLLAPSLLVCESSWS